VPRASGVGWQLEEVALRQALSAWHLRQPVEVKPFAGGVSADVFEVASADGDYVAKFSFDDQDAVDTGLIAAEAAARAGLRASRPLRTPSGQLSTMIEGPPGLFHPLSLMEFVPGRPLDRSGSEAPALVGAVVARLHSALEPEWGTLSGCRTQDPGAWLSYLDNGFFPGNETWLIETVGQVVAEARTFEQSHATSYIFGVFDGPEILVDNDGTLGLIDFGVTQWHPVGFDLAGHGWNLGSADDPSRLDRLVEEYQRHRGLAEADRAGLPIYSRAVLATYAKFAAYKLASGITRGHDLETTAVRLDDMRRRLLR
jgi:Ser/Thr protein kinase RdoA (MazF antagonist)